MGTQNEGSGVAHKMKGPWWRFPDIDLGVAARGTAYLSASRHAENAILASHIRAASDHDRVTGSYTSTDERHLPPSQPPIA